MFSALMISASEAIVSMRRMFTLCNIFFVFGHISSSFTWKLRLSSVDSRKLTELEVGRMRMREEVRPWLTETGLTHWAV